MIGRLLMIVATLLSLSVGIGISAWLEVDSSSGPRVFVPVYVVGSDDDLLRFEVGPPLRALTKAEEEGYLWLDLDRDGVVTGATSTEDPAGDARPYLRRRGREHDRASVIPGSTRLDPALHEQVEYALVRVSPSGTAYLVGMADRDRQVLGRGERAW